MGSTKERLDLVVAYVNSTHAAAKSKQSAEKSVLQHSAQYGFIVPDSPGKVFCTLDFIKAMLNSNPRSVLCKNGYRCRG